MNKWQQGFAKKVELARGASRDRFEHVAGETIEPTYEDFKGFVTQQGLQSAAPLVKNGIRTFKFAVAENAYTLMTFRLAGLAQCELHAEFFVPNRPAMNPITEQIELSDIEKGWVINAFESTLDTFIEAFVATLTPKDAQERELVGAR